MPQLKKSLIPAISDERIAQLSTTIRPTVRDEDDKLRYIEPVEPRSIAFPWDPKFEGLAEDLTEVARIRTLHTWAYYGFFKPTVAEVLAQIPAEYVEKVVAFETNGPETVTDLNKESEMLNAGYHVAETILYAKT